MKRIFALLLTMLMVLPLFACGESTGTSAPSADNGGNTPAANAVTDAVTEAVPAYKPAVTDLEGRTFHIMSKMENTVDGRWTEHNFEELEAGGDVVNDAIVYRNQILEEQFNCTIQNVFEKMGGIFSYTMYQTIAKLIEAGDDSYDLYMPTVQDCAKLSVTGMLYDMKDYDCIQLDREWWNQVVIDATSIGGKVYYADGDIAETFMRAAYAIFFNKQLIKDFTLDDPYALVGNNKWTIDKVLSDAKAASVDMNSNGFMDSEDRIGLLVLYNSTEAFYAASGVKLVTVDENGRLTWTGGSERSIQIMNKISDLYKSTDAVLNCDKKEKMLTSDMQAIGNVQRGETLFSNDKALYLFGTMNNVKAMRSMDTDFGILPLPKADDTQDRYYSYVHTWSASAACIALNVPDPAVTAQFIEAAAYYAAQEITPAYYDVMLKTKVSRDEESLAMLDMIYANRWCDLGNIFNVGAVLSDFTSNINNGQDNFASMIAAKESKIESELAEINDALVG